jgi:hypothetical protein
MGTPILPIQVDEYRLFGFPPCQPKDVIEVQNKKYHVQQMEPLFYIHYNYNNIGAIIPWNPQIYQVNDLVPPDGIIYYIQGIGIEGNLSINLNIPQGHPHSAVETRLQFMDNVMAPRNEPLTYKFSVRAGNTPAVDVQCAVGTVGSIWFFGWKLLVSEASMTEEAIRLPDLFKQGR